MKLKVGDKLYRVYDGMGEPAIESVTITRITPQAVWFDHQPHPLAFGCRVRLDLDIAERGHRTPVAAAYAYHVTMLHRLEEAKADVVAAAQLLARVNRKGSS